MVVADVFAGRAEGKAPVESGVGGIGEYRRILNLDDACAVCARGVELNEPQLSGNALRIERAQGEPISERDSDCGSAERKRHRAAVVRADVGSSCECERSDP